MTILFVGDVVGKAGRTLLREQLDGLRERYGADLTIVNVENAAGGFGLTPALGRQILRLGVDAMTSGNHIWDKKELRDYLDEEPRLLRPGNYTPRLPGRGSAVIESADGRPVAVLSAQGRVFMPLTDCPFRWIEAEVERLRQVTPLIVVDFHAEATSEKQCMGWFLDGKVSAVIGTHTHVQTADARILPGGTAYISDAGMTGAHDSIIGMHLEGALDRLLTGTSQRLKVSSENPRLSAVILEIDEKTGKAISIEATQVAEPSPFDQ